MPLQKVVAVQDESSHWYIIPADQKEKFGQISNDLYNTYNNVDIEQEKLTEFETIFFSNFDKYRVGGDLNNIQLYADI